MLSLLQLILSLKHLSLSFSMEISLLLRFKQFLKHYQALKSTGSPQIQEPTPLQIRHLPRILDQHLVKYLIHIHPYPSFLLVDQHSLASILLSFQTVLNYLIQQLFHQCCLALIRNLHHFLILEFRHLLVRCQFDQHYCLVVLKHLQCLRRPNCLQIHSFKLIFFDCLRHRNCFHRYHSHFHSHLNLGLSLQRLKVPRLIPNQMIFENFRFSQIFGHLCFHCSLPRYF